MVWSVICNVRQALKYRGGVWGLLEHMYTNGDYPFKFGTYMGCDAAGNRYYENRVDYPWGQHRWVEPGDIHNFDSTHVPPEWHGWLTHMNDVTPTTEDEHIREQLSHAKRSEISDVPPDLDTNVGHQEEYFHFHKMHNQSTIRSRGYGIGNAIVGLPPGAPNGYYTQPGSPYNPASIRPLKFVGDLDEEIGGGSRPYKNNMWRERLMTDEERQDEKDAKDVTKEFVKVKKPRLSLREQAILDRGGSLASGKK